jgi:Rod binding domain-containing protein
MEPSAAINTPLPQILPPDMQQGSRRDTDPLAVGKQFEGMFASMLIKQMRQTLDGGLFGEDKSDVLGGLFDHFLGEHIAQAGGFGVADMIRTQLARQPERTRTA